MAGKGKGEAIKGQDRGASPGMPSGYAPELVNSVQVRSNWSYNWLRAWGTM
jgi:hypothetical protein